MYVSAGFVRVLLDEVVVTRAIRNLDREDPLQRRGLELRVKNTVPHGENDQQGAHDFVEMSNNGIRVCLVTGDNDEPIRYTPGWKPDGSGFILYTSGSQAFVLVHPAGSPRHLANLRDQQGFAERLVAREEINAGRLVAKHEALLASLATICGNIKALERKMAVVSTGLMEAVRRGEKTAQDVKMVRFFSSVYFIFL